MADFLIRLFKRNNCKKLSRDGLSAIPCEEEPLKSTGVLSGLGQRLPCYETNANVAIVKDERKSYIAAKDGYQEGDLEQKTNKKHPGGGNQAKHKVTLDDLRSTRPPGFQKFEDALGSQDLDEEVALQLWEDIFKPLYTFDLLKTDSRYLEL